MSQDIGGVMCMSCSSVSCCIEIVARVPAVPCRSGQAVHAIVQAREARLLTLVNIMTLEHEDEEKNFRRFMHMEVDVEQNLRRRRGELFIDEEWPQAAYIGANRRSREVCTPCVFGSRPYRLADLTVKGHSASGGA